MNESKTTQAQVSVITEPEILSKLQALSDHIAFFLSRKAMVEYRKQDIKNPTLLAGIKFWFQIDPNNGSTILCYDKHPTEWDVDKIMKEISELEHIFYVQEGNIIHWKW